jgi:hypothetical protein
LATPSCPSSSARNWTEEQVRAFRLLVNRSATWAEWDLDAIAHEIAELSETDFDPQLTGFDPAEIEEFLSPLLD